MPLPRVARRDQRQRRDVAERQLADSGVQLIDLASAQRT